MFSSNQIRVSLAMAKVKAVILDTKDKISGVRDILTRISWIRDNFRSNSYCESSYAESGVLVMEV